MHTTQGLADDLDMLKIAKALKKTFKCNGCINIDPEYGEILQLSGRLCMICAWFDEIYNWMIWQNVELSLKYTIQKNDDDDDVIGDQRTNVKDFFVDQEVCHEDQIVIHGG